VPGEIVQVANTLFSLRRAWKQRLVLRGLLSRHQ
jgi:hypothetical protein